MGKTNAPPAELEAHVVSKVAWKLIPFIFMLYIFNFLDRVNIGFAALTMREDLGFTATVYGLGAGMFFLAYFLFEVPSNLILHRVGARTWIARIAITWGLVSIGFAFVNSQNSFYALRFLLGMAEAGFFPGIIYYLSFWFPEKYRARMFAYFLAAVPISSALGSPLSATVLGLDGAMGLRGWQWLFILEGIPSILLGIMVPFALTSRPADAKWLTGAEREWLLGTLEAEEKEKLGRDADLGWVRTLGTARVWAFCGIYFCIVVGIYALSFWLPQMIKAFGFTTQQVGIVNAIPYALGAVCMLGVAAASDRNRQRVIPLAFTMFLGGCALMASSAFPSAGLNLGALTIAAVCLLSSLALFWTLPTSYLTGPTAAAAIAFITSVANLGGLAGPYLMGAVKDATGSFQVALTTLAILPLVGAAGVLALRRYSSTGKKPQLAPLDAQA
jgi:MFS family permease